MYGKVFQQIYDGTLVENWKALVTFQQMIVLCDSQGVIDMTPEALARRTGIPLDIIREGITNLESPDPSSRTPDQQGRRIERIDAHREWGWQIVNHAKYQKMVSHDEKRASDRERLAAKRASVATCRDLSQGVASCREVSQPVASRRNLSQPVADVAHTDAYTDADTNTEKQKDAADASDDLWDFGIEVLKGSGLGERTARSFIGSLCKSHDESVVLEAMRLAAGKADPKQYALGVLKDKPKRGQRRRSAAEELMEELNAGQ